MVLIEVIILYLKNALLNLQNGDFSGLFGNLNFAVQIEDTNYNIFAVRIENDSDAMC